MPASAPQNQATGTAFRCHALLPCASGTVLTRGLLQVIRSAPGALKSPSPPQLIEQCKGGRALRPAVHSAHRAAVVASEPAVNAARRGGQPAEAHTHRQSAQRIRHVPAGRPLPGNHDVAQSAGQRGPQATTCDLLAALSKCSLLALSIRRAQAPGAPQDAPLQPAMSEAHITMQTLARAAPPAPGATHGAHDCCWRCG